MTSWSLKLQPISFIPNISVLIPLSACSSSFYTLSLISGSSVPLLILGRIAMSAPLIKLIILLSLSLWTVTDILLRSLENSITFSTLYFSSTPLTQMVTESEFLLTKKHIPTCLHISRKVTSSRLAPYKDSYTFPSAPLTLTAFTSLQIQIHLQRSRYLSLFEVLYSFTSCA
jgi:hypothetical protein